LQPTWQSGVDAGGNEFTDLDDSLYLIPQVSTFGGNALESVTLPSGQYTSTTYYCEVSSGYVFIDPDGGNHGMGLFNATNPSNSPNGCANVVPNGDSNYLTGGDEQYKASITNTFPATATVVDLHGDVVSSLPGSSLAGPYQAATRTASVEDTNGNLLNTTGRNWTFSPTSAGFTFEVPGTAQGSNSPGSYTFTNEKEVEPSFSLPVTWVGPGISGPTYCKVSSIPTLATQGTVSALQSIEQPNGESYQFTYEPVYGLINQITYPTGATVSYTWSTIPNMEGVQYRNTHGNAGGGICEFRYGWFAITQRVVSYNGIAAEEQDFNYQTNWPAVGTVDSFGNDISYKWTSKTTTVTTTDKIRGTSYQTIYNYLPAMPPPTTDFSGQWGDQGYMPVENTIQYKDTNGTLLKTVTKVWYQWGGQSLTSLLAGECETLPNGQTSGTFYTYQPDGTFGGENPLASMTNLPTDVAVYDYSSSIFKSGCVNPSNTIPSPSALRETVTAYHNFPVTLLFPYPSILDRPDSVKVYGNGTLLSETDYGWDEYTKFPLTVVSPAPIGQDPRYASASVTTRGNPTTVTKKCFVPGGASCTNSVTSYTYDITGQVTSVTDPCGYSPCGDMAGSSHTTNYFYTDNYTSDDGSAPGNTNAYVTKIILPPTARTHTTNYQYGFEDGKLRSAKDIENGTTNTYCYWTGGCSGSTFDPFFRLTGIRHPDGGVETVSYSDAGPNPSVTVSTLINSSTTMTKETAYDEFAHPVHTYLSDPYGADTIDITYDGLGRVMTKSNPYRSTSDTTYGISSYYYDALGRQVKEIEQDGSILQTCYNGTASTYTPAVANCSSHLGSVTTGTWVDSSDETGNHWQRTSNVLGQLMDVVEPNGITQAPTMEADYGYDALSNLLNVTQWGGPKGSTGARVRTFNYDSLSRLLCSSNPENSSASCPTVATGAYVAGTNGYSYDANGNVNSKMDARGVTTSYTYDVLNRLLSKSYSDAVTPSSCYQYDSSSDGRLSAEWTQSGSCPGTAPTTGFMTMRTFLAYDPMGRVKNEQQCTPNVSGPGNCTSSLPNPFALSYGYDLGGDLTAYTSGVSNIPTVGSISFGMQYDAAGRLQNLNSSWNPAASSSGGTLSLFTADTTNGYWPSGAIWNMFLGNDIYVHKTYDIRLRITGETATHP
jgi:YD repeat-containing protein